MGLHELLILNEDIKQIVLETGDAHAIKKKAIRVGMKTLKMDGASKVLKGLTTIEEILSLGYQEASR